MDNVLLGKTVKAMYKLSGKTLTQLSDETDLTVDTINNFFYARLQKPGFIGVSALVEATGYTVAELVGFMEKAEKLPKDADITEEFTKYIFSAKNTIRETDFVNSATACAKSTEGFADCASCCGRVKALTEDHERQLDRFREVHLHYVEELNASHKEQVTQMEESIRRLKEHYDHSVGEIKKRHAYETEKLDAEIKALKKSNFFFMLAMLCVSAAAITAVMILALK